MRSLSKVDIWRIWKMASFFAEIMIEFFAGAMLIFKKNVKKNCEVEMNKFWRCSHHISSPRKSSFSNNTVLTRFVCASANYQTWIMCWKMAFWRQQSFCAQAEMNASNTLFCVSQQIHREIPKSGHLDAKSGMTKGKEFNFVIDRVFCLRNKDVFKIKQLSL